MRDAGAAATSADIHVDNTQAGANEMSVGAEENGVPRAAAVAAKAKASTTKPKLLQDNAWDGTKALPTGGGAGDDTGEFFRFFSIYY